MYLLNMIMLVFRFLASGNSQISMSFSYGIVPSTVHFIIMSPCEAVWNELSPTELPPPTEEEWGGEREREKKPEEFYSLWQFPNCIGAIDGKHTEIQELYNCGSFFFN